MSENRDPIECKGCKTVNAWNAETCRTCHAPLSSPAEPDGGEDAGAEEGSSAAIREDASPAEGPSRDSFPSSPDIRDGSTGRGGPLERRWNVFWIVIGIAIHIVIVNVGTFSIIKLFIEPHPELKSRLEQAREAANASEAISDPKILEDATDEARSKMNTVLVLFVLLIGLTPILLGAAIGFHTGRILEVAAAMGLSAVLIPLLDNAAAFAVIWGPVNAGLGALGAFLALLITGRYSSGGRSRA